MATVARMTFDRYTRNCSARGSFIQSTAGAATCTLANGSTSSAAGTPQPTGASTTPSPAPTAIRPWRRNTGRGGRPPRHSLSGSKGRHFDFINPPPPPFRSLFVTMVILLLLFIIIIIIITTIIIIIRWTLTPISLLCIRGIDTFAQFWGYHPSSTMPPNTVCPCTFRQTIQNLGLFGLDTAFPFSSNMPHLPSPPLLMFAPPPPPFPSLYLCCFSTNGRLLAHNKVKVQRWCCGWTTAPQQ